MSRPICPRVHRRRRARGPRASAANRSATTRSRGSSSLARPSPTPSSARRASSTSSSAHSELPTECPCALRNGKHMAPPIRIESATSRNRSMTSILSLTLAPPSTATSGRSGFSSRLVRVFTSRSRSSPAARSGSSVGDAFGRGVGTVRGAEGIVDVDVGEIGKRGRQIRIVLRLPRLVAHVLQHEHVAGARARR